MTHILFRNRFYARICICLVSILIPFSNYSQSNTNTEHVILISIDGLNPEWYLNKEWPTPNLQYLAKTGVYAQKVRPVYPSSTYPGHTTIITGALPDKHGIFYNINNQNKKRHVRADEIETMTFWDATKKKKLKSASIFWPVSIGAPVDFCIPNIKAISGGSDDMEALRAYIHPKGLIEELEQNALGKFDSLSTSRYYLSRTDQIGNIAAYLIEKYKVNLMAVHFISTDFWQHKEGRKGLMVSRAVSAVDFGIGKIMEAVKRAGIADNTSFIILGDHGFVDIHSTLCPNVWLKKAGLITDNNWKAKFHAAGASAFLHLKDPNDKQTLARVKQTLGNLPESQRKLFRIITKEQLDAVGAAPDALLALDPIPGFMIKPYIDGSVIRSSGKYKGMHGYYPDFKEIHTGFIGWGNGFNKQMTIPILGLEDIAPIVSELLDLDFESPDGLLYPGIIR